jgi:hypothetical protein
MVSKVCTQRKFSFRVRIKRSATPLPSGWRTKEDELSMPPLSGSFGLYLGEDAGGGDMFACGLAVNVAFLHGWFWLPDYAASSADQAGVQIGNIGVLAEG